MTTFLVYFSSVPKKLSLELCLKNLICRYILYIILFYTVCFLYLAIFLLDAAETVYLWFGWWPDDEEGTEASNSRRRRWDEERRKAMESAVAYANGSLVFFVTLFVTLLLISMESL